MKRATKKTSISFKCHYCGKGSDKTLLTNRTSANASRSLERDRRLVSGNVLNRSKSSLHTTYLPPLNGTPDYSYTPGKTLTEDDLREELVQLKRRYKALNHEHDILKTHFTVANNDLKKREQEIENLLQDPVTLTKDQEQLEMNSLKRKIIQYERALREKSQEINNLLGDKNIFNATEMRKKMIKLETDCAKLKHRLEKSVPYAELDAERSKLAEMIETLQRENEELHHMLEAAFQENDDSTLLDANGIRDPKMLEKMRKEAAIRRQEVEQYQRALSSLIRERTLPAIGTPNGNKSNHIGRSLSAKPNKINDRLASATAKSEKHHHHLHHSHSHNEKEKVRVDAKRPLKPIKSVPTSATVRITNYPKVAEIEAAKSKARLERSKTLTKTPKNGKTIPGEKASKSRQQQNPPVKHINQLMHYEETESSAKSPDLLTPPDSEEEKTPKTKNKKVHDASSVGSAVTNADYDNDSNIGAINSEYQEKEMDDRVTSLITALRCQLLREEMIQTRVMSF